MWLVMLLLLCWIDPPWYVQAAFVLHTIFLTAEWLTT